jgi:hypothetical protein
MQNICDKLVQYSEVFHISAHGYEDSEMFELNTGEFIIMFRNPGKSLDWSDNMDRNIWNIAKNKNMTSTGSPMETDQIEFDKEIEDIFINNIRNFNLKSKHIYNVYTGIHTAFKDVENLAYNWIPNLKLNFSDTTQNWRMGIFPFPVKTNMDSYGNINEYIRYKTNIGLQILSPYLDESILNNPPYQLKDIVTCIRNSVKSKGGRGFIMFVSACRTNTDETLILQKTGVPLPKFNILLNQWQQYRNNKLLNQSSYSFTGLLGQPFTKKLTKSIARPYIQPIQIQQQIDYEMKDENVMEDVDQKGGFKNYFYKYQKYKAKYYKLKIKLFDG